MTSSAHFRLIESILFVALLLTSGVRLHAQPAPVTITVTPSGSSFPIGATITLEAMVGGGITPLGYSWRKNSALLDGQTAKTLTLTNAQPADTGLYDVSVKTSPTSSTTSTPAGITVTGGSPLVLIPASITTDPGLNWGFSLSKVSGFPALGAPQWYKDNVLISGASGATLFLNNAQASDVGTYTAVLDGVVSNPGVLRLNGPPVFAEQPSSTWGDIGASAGFGTSFVPTNSNLTFQWYKDGIPLTGQNLPSINIYPIVASSYGTYTLMVSSPSGSTTSNGAVLSPRVPPTITQQPQSQAVATGGTISLHVSATGPNSILPITYQWRKDGADLTGATSSDLTILNASAANAGFYSVTVNGTLGYLSSDSVSVTVGFNAPIAGTPGIQGQPITLTVAAGGTALFTVAASGAVPMAYQWSHNGVALPGTNSATLTLNNVQGADAGSYQVVVTNSAGNVTSQVASLTVTSPPTTTSAPVVNQPPQSLTVTIGATASFSVSVSGAAPLSYTWKKRGIPITGPTAGAIFVIPSVQAADVGDYSVSISNPYGAVTSSSARLSLASPPVIVQPPSSSTVTVGEFAVVSAAASGEPVPSVLWRHNGVVIPGAGSPSLVFNHAQFSDAGSYQAVFTNAYGTVTSELATLTVRAPAAQAGIYFGTFGAEGKSGTFALRVNGDGQANLIGYLIGTLSGFSVSALVDATGHFSVNLPAETTIGKTAVGPGSANIRAQAVASFTGLVGGGVITGLIDTLNLSAKGQLTASSPTNPSAAGYYSSPVVNTANGVTHAMIGADGQVLLISTGDAPEIAAQGQLTPNGTFDTTTVDGLRVTAVINESEQSLSGTMSSPAEGTLKFAGVSSNAVRTDRLINISTRGHAGEGERALIAGFVVQGSESKRILVRAVGPSLATLGVNGSQTDTLLTLYQGGVAKAESDDWSGSADAQKIASVSAQLGAFPLSSTSKDAVLLATLAPGAYTAQVTSPDRSYGIVLVEVYDAAEVVSAAGPKLANISTRGAVGTGDDVLIAGIVVTGNSPKRVLIRAIGPSLAEFGVQAVLDDPQLTLFNGATAINGNDDWGGKDEIATAAKAVGAFELPTASKDSSILVTLAPGAYTAIVTGKNNSSGVALIEVYEIQD